MIVFHYMGYLLSVLSPSLWCSFVCIRVHVDVHQFACGQRTAGWSWFCLSTMLVLGMEPRLLDLVVK